MRRAKQVSFRRQRLVVEVPSEESGAYAADESDSEKIEVHVHLHQSDSKRSRSKRPPPPTLTGALFDWQWYRDQLSKRQPPTLRSRWSLSMRCSACDTVIPTTARRCPRCAAPRPRRRILPTALALIGLASIAVVFALCAHVLGGSVPEVRAPQPLGNWTDDDYVIVEVPATTPASPFGSTLGASNSSTGSGIATR
jgi:hypothetical protein